MKNVPCHVCNQPITPDADGTVRIEGFTLAGKPRYWAWGPVRVHDDCRTELRTPYDDRPGYVASWGRVTA